MKKLMYFSVLLIALFAVAGLSWSVGQATAQSSVTRADAPLGSGFTYQGYLNKNGAAVTASCDFQFSLWDQAVDGLQIGALQQINSLSVVAGRFSVILNNNKEMLAKPFTGKARFLKVAVRCPNDGGAFTTLAPRQNLTAAPYAHTLRPGALIAGTTSENEGVLNLNGNYDGLRVSAADDGIFVDATSGHGINIGSPQDNGVYIRNAVNGIEMDQISSNGVYLNGVQENGLHVIGAGNNGVQIDSYGNVGIQIKGGITETALFAASFLGDVDIQGELNCSQANCGIQTRAVNRDDDTLQVGDIVAVAGIEAAADGNMLIQVRRAEAGDTLYGVVSGSAEMRDELLVSVDAPTASGALLFIVTEGMARVDAGQLNSAEIGSKVELSGNHGNGTLGIALEANPARDGLIWVLVDPQ